MTKIRFNGWYLYIFHWSEVLLLNQLLLGGFVQDCSISIADALEIPQSCTKPSIYVDQEYIGIMCCCQDTIRLTAGWQATGTLGHLATYWKHHECLYPHALANTLLTLNTFIYDWTSLLLPLLIMLIKNNRYNTRMNKTNYKITRPALNADKPSATLDP